MSDLTPNEYHFLRMLASYSLLKGPKDIMDLRGWARREGEWNVDAYIAQLSRKRVLDTSPDGRKVKFTDYGLDLFRAMHDAQETWEKEPVTRVSTVARDEIVIKAGETFKANRVLRDMIATATSELAIIDPYVGVQIFDLIEDSGRPLKARIVTSDKITASTKTAYAGFKTQYGSVEMKVLAEQKLHDRYVLCDGVRGFHLGHSIKDLGKKDTQINRLKDVAAPVRLFEQRWTEAQAIP